MNKFGSTNRDKLTTFLFEDMSGADSTAFSLDTTARKVYTTRV